MPLTCAVGRASAETVAGVPEAPTGAGSSAAAGAAGASAIAPRGTRTAATRPLRIRRGSFTEIPFRTYSDHGHATLHMVDTPCPTRGAGLAHSTPKTTCLPSLWRFTQPHSPFPQHRPFGRIMRLRRHAGQIAASASPEHPPLPSRQPSCGLDPDITLDDITTRHRFARYLVGGPGWSGAGPAAVGMMSCPCLLMIRGVLSPAAAGRW